MHLILISGMSGAGKATAANALEEHGYYVVDNLPPSLISALLKEVSDSGLTDKVCVVSDARCGQLIHGLGDAVKSLRESGFEPSLLFIDASNPVLVHRFSETRRHHPFGSDNRGVLAGIEHERSLIHHVKALADVVFDTTDMTTEQLRKRVLDIGASKGAVDVGLSVNLTTFGFKFGLPIDADLVFDVRFLANPYYQDDLRPYDGRNKIIDDFVMNDPAALPFLEKVTDLLTYSLPRYIEEGKAYLTIAIGCTGGRHRSIVIAERLGSELRKKGYKVVNSDRDVSK